MDDTLSIFENLKDDVEIVSREQWSAKEAKDKEYLEDFPLPYIVFVHTNTDACSNKKDCMKLIKDLQKIQMDKGAPDILYNYLISTDGTVYEGRGPRTVGLMYPKNDKEFSKANKRSITIACIDNGTTMASKEMMQAAGTLTNKLATDNVIGENVEFLWYRGKQLIGRKKGTGT